MDGFSIFCPGVDDFTIRTPAATNCGNKKQSLKSAKNKFGQIDDRDAALILAAARATTKPLC